MQHQQSGTITGQKSLRRQSRSDVNGQRRDFSLKFSECWPRTPRPARAPSPRTAPLAQSSGSESGGRTWRKEMLEPTLTRATPPSPQTPGGPGWTRWTSHIWLKYFLNILKRPFLGVNQKSYSTSTGAEARELEDLSELPTEYVQILDFSDSESDYRCGKWQMCDLNCSLSGGA